MKEMTPENRLHHEAVNAAGFQLGRALLLGKFGMYVAGSVLTAHMIVTSNDARFEDEQRAEIFLEGYPPIDEDIRAEASQYEMYTKMTSEEGLIMFFEPGKAVFADGDGLTSETETSRVDTFKNLVDIDEKNLESLGTSYDQFKTWYETRNLAADSLRPDEWDFAHKKGEIALLLLLRFGLYPITKLGLDRMEIRKMKLSRIELAWRKADIPASLHPEWVGDIPTKKVMRALIKNAALLPPIGAKAIEIQEGSYKNHIMEPAYVAEAIAGNVNQERSKYGNCSSHHLTVQGRLPDQFKYAGLAMVLNSPYSTDWEKPFYAAHWGSVGPMIHDGGRTKENINANWRKVRGRTDYIQRIFLNFGESENTDAGLAETNTLANQAESMRMQTEARFFQRAALAMHAKNRTTPSAIDRKTRKLLADIWDSFHDGMQKVLVAMDINDFDGTRWFLDEPVDVDWWNTKRYEAEYAPISKMLTRVEEARTKDEGDIRKIMSQAMDKLSDDVDRAIGVF